MSETTTFTPTAEDVERATDVLMSAGLSVTYPTPPGPGLWDRPTPRPVAARAVLATIGPIIERERRAAKVEALREVIREAGESSAVTWHFVERLEFILSEIERGE